MARADGCVSKCQVCRAEYKKWRISQKVCGSVECAEEFAKRQREKSERRELMARKQAIKSRSEWLKEAQVAVNAYIRERDRHEPCISCGRWHQGQWHAGHYRTVKAAPELRFNELNIHKQCAPCNGPMSGNIVEYRIRLIQKIGLAKVEWLEGKHEPAKYTIEDAKRIKSEYKAKLKELQQEKSAA